MNVGVLINVFENETDNSLKSFNEVFKLCPIDIDLPENSNVEIGDIVNIGDELKRNVIIGKKNIEHRFSIVDYEIKNLYGNINNPKKYKPRTANKNCYCAENNEGYILARENNLESLAKKIGISLEKAEELIKTKKIEKNTYIYKMGSKSKKRGFKRYKYIVQDGNNKLEFFSRQDAGNYLGVHFQHVSCLINGKHKYSREDVIVTKKEIEVKTC